MPTTTALRRVPSDGTAAPPPCGGLPSRPAPAPRVTFTEDADHLERAARFLARAEASQRRHKGTRGLPPFEEWGLTWDDAVRALWDRAHVLRVLATKADTSTRGRRDLLAKGRR